MFLILVHPIRTDPLYASASFVLINSLRSVQKASTLTQCICSPTFFWYVKGTHFRNPLHQHSEKKVLRDEIILHKVSKSWWIWENFREVYSIPALFAWDKRALVGHYLDSFLSDPLKCIIPLLDEPFISEWWCNGLLNCVPFTYKKIYFGGYRYTLSSGS